MSNHDYPMREASTAHPTYSTPGSGLGRSNQSDLATAYPIPAGVPSDETLRSNYQTLLDSDALVDGYGVTVSLEYDHSSNPSISWPDTAVATAGASVASSDGSFAASIEEAGGPSSPFTPNLKAPGAGSPGTTNHAPSTPTALHPLPGHLSTRPPFAGEGSGLDPKTSSGQISGQKFKNLSKGSSDPPPESSS